MARSGTSNFEIW